MRGDDRGNWQHGPRISLFSSAFRTGRRYVDDLITHEALHAWLAVTGRDVRHGGPDWYAAVRRLSPLVLGRQVDARRGADRRSVRVPNPDWTPGGAAPKTVVRKQPVPGAVPHADVARWLHPFRPEGYDRGTPIPCPAERPQLVVSGFGHLDVSALVRPLPRRVVRGSQMSAILAVPVPIEVMAMARAGGADDC